MGSARVLVAMFWLATVSVVHANGSATEVRYEVVSGAKRGEPLFSVIFFSPGACAFTEYWPNGVAYFGGVERAPNAYRVDSLAFPFRYDGPLRRGVSVPLSGGTARYVGDRTIRVGSVELQVHAFEVRTELQSRTLFVSDDYILPVGYDARRMKVRVNPEDLARLASHSCEGVDVDASNASSP